MDCSGKDNCECEKCCDEYSSDDSTCSTIDKCKKGNVYNHLPYGAIPFQDYMHHHHNNGYAPPLPYASGFSRRTPHTMMVPLFPLDNIFGLDSGAENKISISFLHHDGQVLFQWESFRGQLSTNNIQSVALSTAPPYLPIYTLHSPITIDYNGETKYGYVSVDPKCAVEQIKFFFDTQRQIKTKKGDIIKVNGGAISFITNTF